MRKFAHIAAPLGLALLLCSCAPQRPDAPQPEPLPAPKPTLAPQAAISETEVLSSLNILVNDTVPGSDDFEAKRAALTPVVKAPGLSPDLRWPLAQVLAFNPPRLRERWQHRLEAQENAAALYAANPPENFAALNGSRVVRRLGPVLYLVRLPGDDTVLLSSNRRFKKGARLKHLFVYEQLRPLPDKSKGDLVDELADQPRAFVEITRQEAKMREAERAPVLARLKGLEAQGGELERAVAADLARLDTMTRDVNAVISPRLLRQGSPPAPTVFIRKVRRIAKNFSRPQYYRYALPITGKAQVDAVLKGYLEERKTEVQDLLHTTGVGRGRARANSDRIAFKAFTASKRLLSVRFEELRDTGGAHPNMAYATFVFDMQRQARLGLVDIFTDTPAALKILSELATRRMEMVLDGTSFPEGLTPKPQNFSAFVLDGSDLVFTFPPYQTASYAQGPQTLRVPLCHPRLLPLLAPGFLQALATE
ncbi:MAG: RsiV family protein [Humidesulfovibrio sp.]|nr:RsiV family protein [Humidesulfovibrio sp.]